MHIKFPVSSLCLRSILVFLFPVSIFSQTLSFSPPDPTDWFQETYQGVDEEEEPVTLNVWNLVGADPQPSVPPLPDSGTTTVVTNGRHAIIAGGNAEVNILRISNNDGGGTVEMSGGSLSVAANLQMATGGSGHAVFELSGGSMTVNTRLQLASNNSSDASAEFLYLGGSLQTNAVDVGVVGTGVLALSGSNANVWTGNNLFLGGGVSGTLRFALDAEGAPRLTLNQALTINSNAAVEIDATAYTGDTQTFMLIEAANITGDLTGGLTSLELSSSYSASLRQENHNLYLDIELVGNGTDPDPDVESFWEDLASLRGFKDTGTAAGHVYDAYFPWVYSAPFRSWLYVDVEMGSATAFSAYHVEGEKWFQFDVEHPGHFWSFSDEEWQELYEYAGEGD